MESYNSTFVWKNFRIKLHNLRQDQIGRIYKISYARRFLYNWGIDYATAKYLETGKTPPYQEMARELTRLKKIDENFKWLDNKIYNVNSLRYAFVDLCAAYHNYLTGKCKRPIYKHRKSDSARFASDKKGFYIKKSSPNLIFIPGVSMYKGDCIDCGNHNIPYGDNVEYSNIRVKFDGVDFWLSLSVKLYRPIEFNSSMNPEDGIGIDIGIRTTAALSNGKMYDAIPTKRLDVLQHRRNVLQASVDRDLRRRMKLSESTRTKYYDIPKSKNQIKREKRLAKTRVSIHNYYSNFYHKVSRDIVNSMPKFIVLEDLNIPGMFNDAHGKRRFDTYESRMGTLSEYISYKAIEADIPVIYADREFPSSQICSHCGAINHIGKNKTYHCDFCGLEIDRDLNAAYNLRDYGLSKMNQID